MTNSEQAYAHILAILAKSPEPLSSAQVAKQTNYPMLTTREVGRMLGILADDNKVQKIVVPHNPAYHNLWEAIR